MRPSRDELLHQHALLVAERGTCSRLKVGAVLARDGRILVTGYNGAPAGMPHCFHTCSCEVGISASPHREDCRILQPCTVSVHAEANVIAYAARHGITTLGAELFTTHSPCLACAQLIINSGITRVVYEWEYRLNQPLDLLKNAGIKAESWKSLEAI